MRCLRKAIAVGSQRSRYKRVSKMVAAAAGIARGSRDIHVSVNWTPYACGKEDDMFRNHYRVGVCAECGTECVMRRRAPRHDLHLCITIATLGLWGPCWLITTIAAGWEPWRCRECKQPQPDDPGEVELLEPASPGTVMRSAFTLAPKGAD